MNVCSQFRKNPDGSWTSIDAVFIEGPNGKINVGPGMTFRQGALFLGLDLAAWLDSNCG